MPRLKVIFTGSDLGRRQAEGLKNLRLWRAWELGRSRCPYCIDLPGADWFVVCDCWMVPDCVERINVGARVVREAWGWPVAGDQTREELRVTLFDELVPRDPEMP